MKRILSAVLLSAVLFCACEMRPADGLKPPDTDNASETEAAAAPVQDARSEWLDMPQRDEECVLYAGLLSAFINRDYAAGDSLSDFALLHFCALGVLRAMNNEAYAESVFGRADVCTAYVDEGIDALVIPEESMKALLADFFGTAADPAALRDSTETSRDAETGAWKFVLGTDFWYMDRVGFDVGAAVTKTSRDGGRIRVEGTLERREYDMPPEDEKAAYTFEKIPRDGGCSYRLISVEITPDET